MNDYQYGKTLKSLKKGKDAIYLGFMRGEPPNTPKKLSHAIKIYGLYCFL